MYRGFRKAGLDVNWLLSGEGEMWVQEKAPERLRVLGEYADDGEESQGRVAFSRKGTQAKMEYMEEKLIKMAGSLMRREMEVAILEQQLADCLEGKEE